MGEVGQFASGGTPSKENPVYWGGQLPFVTGADITEVFVCAKHARSFLTDAGLASGKTTCCPPGTVLFVTRTRVGRVGIATEMIAASQDLSPFTCGPQILPEFVCRYLLSVADYLVTNCRGATIKGLTHDFVHNLQIPLPPLDEQKRIVAILNEQMAAVERARAAAKAQLEATKALPTAFLRQTYADLISEKPGFPRLGNILKLRKEVVHPRNGPRGPAIFVGLEHIESCTGRRLGAENLEMAELTGRKPRFYRGDIVYGYLRPYLNKVWLAEFDGLCSVDQYVYEVDRTVAASDFVAWFIRSPLYLENSLIGETPGWLPRIRTEEVASVKIPLPSIKRQIQIVKRIEHRMQNILRLRTATESELAYLKHLPSSLLRQAFSGKLNNRCIA